MESDDKRAGGDRWGNDGSHDHGRLDGLIEGGSYRGSSSGCLLTLVGGVTTLGGAAYGVYEAVSYLI